MTDTTAGLTGVLERLLRAYGVPGTIALALAAGVLWIGYDSPEWARAKVDQILTLSFDRLALICAVVYIVWIQRWQDEQLRRVLGRVAQSLRAMAAQVGHTQDVTIMRDREGAEE